MKRIPTAEQLAAIQSLRREGGRYVKKLREARGLSQSEVAKFMKVRHTTYVSQVEIGHIRIAPERYMLWANALDIDPKIFVKDMLQYYDPVTHSIIYQTE